MKVLISVMRFIVMCGVFYMTSILSEGWLGDNFGATLIGWVLGFVICFIICILEGVVSYEPSEEEIERDETEE